MASINPNSTWWQRLSDRIVNMPELEKVGIDIQSLGAIEGWEEWFKTGNKKPLSDADR